MAEPVQNSDLARGPLGGLKVLEMSSYMLVPASGSILASFGADVVKVEPAGSSDFSRAHLQVIDGCPVDWAFEFANNAKRSIQLNLRSDSGRAVMHRLLESSDVFLTNVRLPALSRATAEPEELRRKYPRLIIAHATGYGTRGPDANRPAFDSLAYWARAGIAHVLATDDNPPVLPQGAIGDLPTSISIVAGVLMALYIREKSGQGSIVDVSLYGNGIWANAWMLASVLAGGPEPRPESRRYRQNPLYTMYECSDGVWVQLTMFQPEPYWRPVCEALGRDDLVNDDRFSDHEDILLHGAEGISELQATIGRMTVAQLGQLLDARDLPWAPVYSLTDVAKDEQARQNNFIMKKRHRSGAMMDTIAPPFQVRGFLPQMKPSSEVGQDTEQVLLEAGYDWDEITKLRAARAF